MLELPFRADLLFDLLPFLLLDFCGWGSASETASVSSGSPFRADRLFLPPFLLFCLEDGGSGSSGIFSLVAPPAAGAALTGCLSRFTGHVTRRRIRAFITGMGCQAMSAFMASKAWLFADLLGATPVHNGLFWGGALPWGDGWRCGDCLRWGDCFRGGDCLSSMFTRSVDSARRCCCCCCKCPLAELNWSNALAIIPGVYTRFVVGSTSRPDTISSISFSTRSDISLRSRSPTCTSPFRRISCRASSDVTFAPKALATSAEGAVCAFETERKMVGTWRTLSRSFSAPDRYSRSLFL